MAVAFVQAKDSGAVTSGTASSVTLTFTSTATSGNLLVLCASVGQKQALDTPTGWTLVSKDKTAGMWYKISDGTETTVTVTTPGFATRWLAWFGEYSGIDTSSPLDVYDQARPLTGVNCGESDAPSYQGGLYIAYHDLNLSGGGTGTEEAVINSIFNDEMSQRGGDFSWRNGAGDTARLLGQTWDYISPNNYEQAAHWQSTYNTSAANGGGVLAVFKASGASAANSFLSGAGDATFVQCSSIGASSSGTSVGPVWPNTPGQNNLMVAVVLLNDEKTITAPAGWTAMTHTAGQGGYAFYKYAGAAETKTPSWSWTGSTACSATMTEYSGVNTAQDPADIAIYPHQHTFSLQHLAGNDTDQDQYTATNKFKPGFGKGIVIVNFSGSYSGSPGTILTNPSHGFTARGGGTLNSRVQRTADLICDGGGYAYTREQLQGPGIGALETSSYVFIVTITTSPLTGDHWSWADGTADSWG